MDMKVLEHLDRELQQQHQGNRLCEHRTQTLYLTQEISKEEDDNLWQLSLHFFNFANSLRYEADEEALLEGEQFQLCHNTWEEFKNAITKEYHATADEDPDPANQIVRNFEQPDRDAKIMQLGAEAKM